MNTVKKLLLSALAGFAALSCYKNPDLPPMSGPVYDGEANMTIAELKAEFASASAYVEVTDELIIRGYVIGNDRAGNIYKQIYIQDETGGINIGIDKNGLFSEFRVGQEVFVELQGLYLGRYGGELQIGAGGPSPNRITPLIYPRHIFPNGLPSSANAIPRVTTIADLTPEMVNTLVRLDNVSFPEGGQQPFAIESAATNRRLIDNAGNGIDVRTSNFADFRTNILPEGTGSIIAVLGRFNGAWQLMLRTYEDVLFDGNGGGGDEPPPGDEIYRETFGTATVASPWPFISDYTGWNTTGSGASGVSYEGTSTTIRNSGRNNTGGYTGASGPNHVFFGNVPNNFIVKNIALPSGQTKYRLTFGGQYYDNVTNDFNVTEMEVSLSANGTDWIPVTYTLSGDPNTAPNWVFGTADFTLTSAASSLYIKYSAAKASVYRIDDITLETGGGGQSIDLGGGTPPPPPPPSDEIYRETFGTQSVASPWPFVSDYTGWNTTGSGATGVSYEGANTSIRSSGRSSSGAYEGASGPNVMFFGGVPNDFTVKNIALTSSQTNLKLTFGGQFYNNVNNNFNVSEMQVSLSGNGTDWLPLTYTISGDPNVEPNWVFGTADFTLTAAVSSLYIKYSATVASVYRIDDVTLETGNGGQSITLGGGGQTGPVLSNPTPASLSFGQTGGTLTLNYTLTGEGTVSASGLSGILSAGTPSGGSVSVTAQANTAQSAVNQTLVLAVAGGNSISIPVSVAGVGGGGEPGEYFNENFGDGTLTATGSGGAIKVGAYTGWLMTAPITYSDSYGTADIRKTATMNEALWLPETSDAELVISGLPGGKTGITLSYDMAAQNTGTNANMIKVFAGTTELTSLIDAPFATTNTYQTITVNLPDGTTSIRFYGAAGVRAFRIDNVKLSAN